MADALLFAAALGGAGLCTLGALLAWLDTDLTSTWGALARHGSVVPPT